MEYDDREAWHSAQEMGKAVYYLYLLKKGPAWSPESTPEIESRFPCRSTGMDQHSPMVKIGRLVFELHTWMVNKGILP